MSQPSFLTTTQAGERLGISAIRVRQLCNEGRLPATKFGTDWLILPESLKAVEQRRPAGRPPKAK